VLTSPSGGQSPATGRMMVAAGESAPPDGNSIPPGPRG
jgi:hypothetical protein